MLISSPRPFVSVLITYYNTGSFIREAVESARNQTYPDIEVLVIDDGSQDPCAPYLSGLPDVQIIRQQNTGSAGARNAVARHARGEFFLFLDGDDRLLPSAVETQLAAMLAVPDSGLAFGAVQRINERGELTRGPHLCRPRRDYFGMLLESNPFECMGAAMMRRSEFDAIGGFDQTTKNLAPVDDYDIFLRLAYRAPVIRNPQCVVEYRQHTSNVSRDKEMMLSRTFTVLSKLEHSSTLSGRHHRLLQHGRRRWTHAFNPSDTLAWKAAEIYYKFRAMLCVPIQSYFH
jgi:glycosyltransferase involved in cell wall biosynthesis